MLEQILQRAITERATDVHLEPHPTVVYVRMRVDGVLYDNTTYEPAAHAAMVSRVKILAKLDIAQSRAPQDGRFDMALGQNAFDVRVSVVPAVDGEKAVMRLLPKSGSALDFDALGLAGRGRELLASLIARPYGMVIVSGPTGCGKTTTLYAALSTIDCVARNVITIEDPVEYQLARITQLQVNPKAGVTFAGGLRAMLRQDPDIIMVGEIRDPETLQMAIQSSLTGHLVLSTLHCNDAAAGASRMIDMGAEPFLIASGVAGIVAQRLVRKICPSCKKPATVHPVMREKLALPNDNATYYTGAGCAQCRQTGYLGRVGLFEVVPLLEPIQHAIITRANAGDIREIARQHGIPTLRDDGIAKAAAGVTSLEEVMRAVYVEVE
jgi:type II secretory ATPase GspE/PulE/Tfp pilus assembly ATPase PilB-like protein